MLIALAFIFSYIEAMIPIPMPVPVKLGLANLVSVVGLYTIGISGTAAVSLTRIMLTGFTFGNLNTLWYGLAGGSLSLLVMVLMKQSGWFGKTGVSIMGGVAHNIGQLCIYAIVVHSASVFAYLPFLLVAGVVAGSVIGLLGGMIVRHIGEVVNE